MDNKEQEYLEETVAVEDNPDHITEYGNIANQEQHEETVREALTRHPKRVFWLIFAIWLLIITSFDNQVGGIVIGIPQFRKDFGSYYDGNYVLPAKWQSAYSGGPTAS
jgi:MFS transporter, SP family, general alpha glucoside:H+ symporter